MFLFLLLGGMGCILFPQVILAGSGMATLEDEPFFVWFVRVLGIICVGISVWAIYGAYHK